MTSAGRNPRQEGWLRFYNRVLYARLPGLYNAMDWMTLGVWWRLVRRALDYVPGEGRVLEIGFGPGRLQVELVKRADQCQGLDLAMGMCRYTHRRLRRAGLQPAILCGDAYRLPYPDSYFDSLVSTFAFSGLPQGELALAEMTRVTTPGGRIVMVDIGLPRDGNWLGHRLARLWERMGDFLYDLPAMMTAAGLKVASFEEFGPGRHIRALVAIKA